MSAGRPGVSKRSPRPITALCRAVGACTAASTVRSPRSRTWRVAAMSCRRWPPSRSRRGRVLLPASRSDLPGPLSQPTVRRFNGELLLPAALIPEEIEAGRLRALIVLGGNLVAGLPDTERVIATLGQLEALAVLDVRRNATTAVGTHVIACTDQLEHVDVTFLDLFNPAVAVQFSDAVVEPPNSRQPMWRTIATLARSLDFDILGDNADPASVSNDTVLSKAARGLDIDDLRRTGGPRVEASAMYGWAQSKLPTGRWQLAPPPLVAQLQAITHPPGLVVTPRRQLRHQNAQPFRTGDVPDALMHPGDALAAGVSDGEIVEISSATGVLRIELRVTDSTVRGSVSIPHGWEDVNVNRLMSREDRWSADDAALVKV